jgi:DNA polymerase-3 subunit gamma/tau
LAEPPKPDAKEATSAEDAKPLTPESVQNAWKAYSEANSKDPAFLNVLKTSQVQLNEQTIEIILASHVQETFLLEKKTDLMNYLRSTLSNASLQLKTIVNGAKVKEMLYTPGEKFAKLSEKNPELKRLREVLDLELQF